LAQLGPESGDLLSPDDIGACQCSCAVMIST